MSQDRSKLRWNGWGWVARKDSLAAREEVWAWLAGELGMPALLATPPRALEELTLPSSTLSALHCSELSNIVGDSQLRDSVAERAFHTRGRRYRDLLLLRAGDLSDAPDAVIYPRSADEVLAVLAVAAERHIAVIPFGGGTALPDGANGLRSECVSVISLDLSDMDRIIGIDMVSHLADVEAGIYGPALESALKAKGLTLGYLPPSFEFSTLADWIAEGGSDGTAHDWLDAVTLATPTGLVDTDQLGTGLGLTHLLQGSAGRFGIVTEARIRLKPLPEYSEFHAYLFADFPTSLAALRAIRQEGCLAATLHLSDVEETRFFAAFAHLGNKPSLLQRLADHYGALRGLAVKPCHILANFEGNAGSVAHQLRSFEGIVKRYGASRLGKTEAETARAWHLQGPYLRDSLLERAVGVERFEVSASWSKVPTVYDTTRAALDMVLRETAPREGAQGVVLCHLSSSTPWGATLTFTVIFPRAVGADRAQADKIEAAAELAMRASGGTMQCGLGHHISEHAQHALRAT